MCLPRIRKIARAYLWSLVFWLGFAPMLATQHYVRGVEEGRHAPHFYQSLLIDVAWCLTFAILTPPIFLLGSRNPITKDRAAQKITGYVLGFVPFMVAFACVRWTLLPPWDPITQHFGSRSFHSLIQITFRFASQAWTYVGIIVASQAYEYFERAHKQEVERLELQQALAASELQVLKSQLHPHFLFNTLHGISTLIETDSRRAKAMVLRLSGLLRTTLEYQTVELITLEKEIKFAESYLELEKMRLGHRLDVRWDMAAEIKPLLVPELILQPLIENAILHGVAVCREGGWVEISCKLAEPFLQLRVRNTVGGKRQGGTGTGLQNTRARLRYLYSGEARFSFELTEDRKLATATVLLPVLGSQSTAAHDQVSSALM
jgi:two-component system, LytTR family, sensor kinase